MSFKVIQGHRFFVPIESPYTTSWCKKCYDILNRLGVGYECDRQTDRRTDDRQNGRWQQRGSLTRAKNGCNHVRLTTALLHHCRIHHTVSRAAYTCGSKINSWR